MQHCVPVCWEKDIKAGYLKLTSNKKLKADIQIIVPARENDIPVVVLLDLYVLLICFGF